MITQHFDLQGDTGGTWTDTGPPLAGAVVAVQYLPGSSPLDTGANITVSRLARNAAGTYVAQTIYTSLDLGQINSGGAWQGVPRDTGTGTRPPFLAHHRLQAKVTQDSGTAVAGELQVLVAN